ncbi:hypothetical protein BGE01nite_37290 [Brevifollis gellanilyticus]|uniref:Uncharacterized protein n=2 Tax=Brevifollis gellanilyticus TaxID=748831 RepID=A0A512MCI3_9BACT|nr:hypothetical protein BGE01nite_37290 [Brevifollis gellanilyticus]
MSLMLFGFMESSSSRIIVLFEAYGLAWSAFLIARRFIGFTTAHRIALALAILLCTASFVWPVSRWWMYAFICFASLAILTSRRSKKIVCYTLVIALDIAIHTLMSSERENERSSRAESVTAP